MKEKVLAVLTIAMVVSCFSSVGRADDNDQLKLYIVTSQQTVATLGGIGNVDAICKPGDVVIAGGFATLSSGSLPDSISVEDNYFLLSGTTPVGWQTILTNNSAVTPFTLRVYATCTKGKCAKTNCQP